MIHPHLPRSRRSAAALAIAAMVLGGQGASAASLGYIGQAIVSNNATYGGTRIGGLSGIDYDAATRTYVSISDDRSQFSPARYYDLTLDFAQFTRSNTATAAGVNFTGVTTLLNASGAAFGPNQVDPESVRVMHSAGGTTLLWSNEGQRSAAGFQNPTLRETRLDGGLVREFDVPSVFLPTGTAAGNTPGDQGVRNNLAFESVTVSTDGKSVYIANEAALAQDGAIATLGAGTSVRVAQFDYASGQALAQYVYRADAIPVAPVPATGSADNGVSEMLAIGDGSFIAMERSFAAGVGDSIRLYLTGIAGATDVSGLNSLIGADVVAMQKTLLLDLAMLTNADGSQLTLDNIEGITWGADYNGNKTLLLVSDNNFSASQFTQFIALSVNGDLVSAVPEPSTTALMLLGLTLIGTAAKRRR